MQLLAEIITLRAIALKPNKETKAVAAAIRRDHNATSYSTETLARLRKPAANTRRDHNATSYSTETITAYRLAGQKTSRDHNATSYSTETGRHDVK